MYLDTKYLSPTALLSLPTKRDVLFTVANIIRNNPTHKINIAVSRCVKEEVTIALTNLVNGPIWVDQQTLDKLNILRVHSNVTNEKKKCHIFIHTLSIYAFDEQRSEDDITIILRAQMHTEVHEKYRNNIQWWQKRRYFFPYSAHSTPNELNEMLQKLKPTDVIPINVSVNNYNYALQFLMNIDSVCIEKPPMAREKRNAQEEKLYFWKNLGKMEKVLQSDYFCKQSKKTDVHQLTAETNESEMIEERKMTQNNGCSTTNKFYVNCKKTAYTNQKTERDRSDECKWNFQSKYKEFCEELEKKSRDTLNGNYKELTQQQKEPMTVKANPTKKLKNLISDFQVSKDTRQRRKKLYEAKLQKLRKEAHLKELCLQNKCVVQTIDILPSKAKFMKYIGLKPSQKSKTS